MIGGRYYRERVSDPIRYGGIPHRGQDDKSMARQETCLIQRTMKPANEYITWRTNNNKLPEATYGLTLPILRPQQAP